MVSTGHDIAYVEGEHIRAITAEGDTSREIAHFHPAPHSLVWSPDRKRLRFTQLEPLPGTDSMWEISLNGRIAAACASRKRTRPARGKRSAAGRWKYFVFLLGMDLCASLAVNTQASLWLTKRLAWLAGFE